MFHSYRLEEGAIKKSNNLEIMKFLAALCVIIHHSFDLTLNSDKEWIRVITKSQLNFGGLAVSFFFFVSGFYITKSVLKKKNGKQFFKDRIKKVFPPLFVVVVFSIVMGAFVTRYDLGSYLMNKDTWLYLLNSVLILKHNLPGVFENNAYCTTVNGALWTLPVEVLCYIGCFILYKLKLINKKTLVILSGLFFLGTLLFFYLPISEQFMVLRPAVRACLFFLMGMLTYTFRDKIPINFLLFIISILGLVLCIIFNLGEIGMWIFYPYLIIYMAFNHFQANNIISKCGKISYSMYLCGFPIQQLVIHLNGGNMDPYVNLFISALPILIIGTMIYSFVEKRFI